MLTVFARSPIRFRGSSPTSSRNSSDWPGRDPAEQDQVLADVLEQAIADGQKAVERTRSSSEVPAQSGVVDAGGYGLVLIPPVCWPRSGRGCRPARDPASLGCPDHPSRA